MGYPLSFQFITLSNRIVLAIRLTFDFLFEIPQLSSQFLRIQGNKVFNKIRRCRIPALAIGVL
jgi:hypothetical protein